MPQGRGKQSLTKYAMSEAPTSLFLNLASDTLDGSNNVFIPEGQLYPEVVVQCRKTPI